MNSHLSMAMAQARQQELLLAGAGYHGGRRIRRRRFRKLPLSWGLHRSPTTAISGAQATPAA